MLCARLILFLAGAVIAASGGLAQSTNLFVGTEFRLEPVIDRAQGGLVATTFAVPKGWNALGNIEWTYSNVSWPVRGSARASAPDGSAWIEAFPAELFFWLDPVRSTVSIGGYSLGMIHKPNIGIQEAMQRFVIQRYRGKQQNLQIVGFRPVPNLPQALGKPPVPGESIAVRIKYTINGEPVDEEFYALLTNANRIPYRGPQGTWYESHRTLAYVLSMGAKNGKLESLYPVLGFIAASFKVDPIWERHAEQVKRQIAAQFDRNIAAGYAQIQAAAQLSRTISANNDSMIQTLRAQREASNRSMDRVNDNFSQYIRGTQRMKDPYTGSSEQSNQYSYHWTDGFGTYRSSNDASFNPNIGSNQNWQRMEPVGR